MYNNNNNDNNNYCYYSQTRLAFGVLTFIEELVPEARGPGSAKEVAGCGLWVAGVPQGSLKDSL